jgi:MFS transporter, DHA1 family, inner membrane transport protein
MNAKTIFLLALLASIQFTGVVDAMIVMPLGPKLRDLWDISTPEFGRVVSIFSLAAFFSAIISVAYIDRFDRKKVLMLIYAGFTIGTLFCGLATTYYQMLAARFFTGLFGGIVGSIILSILGDSVPNEKRGFAMGILMMGFALASVAGVPAGLYLAATFSWQMPFYALSVLCLVIWLACFFAVPNFTAHIGKVQKQNSFQIIRKIFSDSNMRWALMLSFFVIVSHFMIIPYLTDFFVKNLKFDFKSTVPFVYVVGGAMSAVFSPFVGKMADKFGRYKVLVALTILAIFPLFGIPHLTTSSKYILFMFSSSLFIFSGSRMIAASAMVTSAVQPQMRGSFLVINSSIQQFAIGGGAALGGSIIYNGAAGEIVNYPYVGYLAIAFGIIALFIAPKVKVAQ